MSSRYYEGSSSHPSSDRRSDDTYHNRERLSPASSSRRTPPHANRRKQSPPRGPAALEQPSRDRRDHDESSDSYSNRPYRRSSPRDSTRGSYRDRDRECYRSPRHESRSRSRSRGSPRRRDRDRSPQRGKPSKEIIMEGMPIKLALEKEYRVKGLTDVRIIRDRKTGVSRQFGFLQFADMNQSSDFLDAHYPSLRLFDNTDEGFAVNIAYSREREDRGNDDDWVCGNCSISNYARRALCFRCQAPKSQYSLGPVAEQPRQANNGDSDASLDSTPSQFLLLRGLEPTVSEEMLAKGIAKLYKASDNPGDLSKKPNAKVTSTTATSNFGAQEGSIKRVFVVRNRETDDSWRYGFVEFHSVEDAQAALAKYNAVDKFTIASKSVLASYIHAGVFVPAIRDAASHFSFAATSNPSMRLSYWDQKAYLRELFIHEDLPPGYTTIQEQMNSTDANGKEHDNKTKKRKAEANTPASNKKTVPSHLQFWKDRHAELHGEKKSSQVKVSETSPPGSITDEQTGETQSFTDLSRKCCYLCSRQFKTGAEVNKHERLSQLHRENAKNEDLVSKAHRKLAKAGITSATATAPSEPPNENADYRDRAKERRVAYNQPKKPKVGQHAPKADAEEAAKPRGPSKGASLLGKMGWSEGQGLGAQGTGMTAPIATEVYAQGVGLGAQGGKLGDAVEEAQRNTKGGYGAFVEKSKDQARARYESMKD